MLTVYNLLRWNDNFFQNCPLPDGIEQDILIDTITKMYGPFDVFPTNPKVLQHYCETWFRRKFEIFKKMYETTMFVYDPIENYNRIESYDEKNEDTEDRTSNRSEIGNKTSDRAMTNEDGTENTATSNTEDNSTVHDETVGEVSPYNAESFVNDAKSTSDTTSNVKSETNSHNLESRSQLVTNKDKDSSTVTNNDVDNIQNNRHKFYGLHAHGNIGVTTTQEMIDQERQSVLYDVYLEIARMWAFEFVVMVS